MSKPSPQPVLKDVSPPIRAWLRAEVEQATAAGFNQLETQFLQPIRMVVESNTVRLESIIEALTRKGLLTVEELNAAAQVILAHRDEVARLRTLPMLERAQALLAWNEKNPEHKIRAIDVELHAWILDRAAPLTREERHQWAADLGFGLGFQKLLEQRFGAGAPVEPIPPPADSVETAETAAQAQL